MTRSTCPFAPVLLALSLGPACGDAGRDDDPAADASTTATADTTASPEPTTSGSTSPTTGDPVTPDCTQTTTTLQLVGPTTTTAATLAPGAACSWQLTVDSGHILEISSTAGALTIDDRAEDEPGWHRPREFASTHTLTVDNPGASALAVTLEIHDRGPTPAPIVRARSLVWTQPQIVEDDACGMACLMAAISADGHGGALVRQWFDRFASTVHSERLGPKNLLNQFAMLTGGPDPALWNLDDLPFTITAVHNRLDLANASHCGELRVSLASNHPVFRPFHLIFLFAQRPVPEDISPGGALHCAATAMRWARLGELAEPEFFAAAHATIAEHVTLANFLAAESNEFMIAPWEWRQWFFTDPQSLDNRPLFQTVDIPRLNMPGPDRDAFLAWAADNAGTLSQRRLEIPEAFRAPSARANQGVPWIPLELTPALDAAAPELRRNLEIVGCPACHATDAEFVQTLPNRTFSPFYDKELDARAAFFDAIVRGTAPSPPFGPLQQDPLLPP